MSDRDRYPPRAVMFGGASSIFPVQLADHWRRRGVDVAIVSYDRVRRGKTTPGGAPIVSVGGALNPSPLVRQLLAVASSLRHRRATVDNRKPSQPMPLWTTKIGARAAAARAMRFAPSFVFRHEVYAYGPATAEAVRAHTPYLLLVAVQQRGT